MILVRFWSVVATVSFAAILVLMLIKNYILLMNLSYMMVDFILPLKCVVGEIFLFFILWKVVVIFYSAQDLWEELINKVKEANYQICYLIKNIKTV